MNEMVRMISGSARLELDVCDGKRTIAKATDIFAQIDPDFRDFRINMPGKATQKTQVVVCEIARNANFATMFTSFSHDVKNLVLEQDQILNFVQKYRSWLREKSLANFFLFQAADKLFVARVNILYNNKLTVDLYDFKDNFAWGFDCRHRLVVPQLQPLIPLHPL